ncbi:HEAT repeat domain-containing protein [bacterium]|nr:HEAT repeat domain-containing protein [candidate division CSSED10-310 bacterium]
MKEILNIKEAGEYLSIHPEVLRKKAASGEIPGKKLGSGKKSPWRFHKADLDRLISRQNGQKNWNQREDQMIQDYVSVLKTSDDLDKLKDALHALGMLGAETALEEVARFLESPFDELQVLAGKAMLRIIGSESRDYLYPRLFDNSPIELKVAVAAFFAYHENDQPSVDFLLEVLQTNDNRQNCLQAVLGLLRAAPDKVMPVIRKELNAPHAAIRYRMVMTLEDLDYPDLEEDLKIRLTDSVTNIRKKAAEIAGRKGYRHLVPELVKRILSDDSDEVKSTAGSAISEIYGKNR